MEPEFPELRYSAWQGTLATLHRFSQIVGKVRLAAAPRRNHWWNVPLHLTSRGLTSRPMGRHPAFDIDLDLVDHELKIATASGHRYSTPLPGLSVADFYHQVTHGLRAVGLDITIDHPYPYELSDADRPFSADTEHTEYDPAAVTRAWLVLSQVNTILEEFAGQWSGKTSPVHLFWHSFDVALTRFSDVVVEHSPTTGRVTREAYSRELLSFGFWFGDESFPEAAFYAYSAPEPGGLTRESLRPAAAQWQPSGSGHLAVLRYDDVRSEPYPGALVLDFYDSAYRAAARYVQWDPLRYDSPRGSTDPLL